MRAQQPPGRAQLEARAIAHVEAEEHAVGLGLTKNVHAEHMLCVHFRLVRGPSVVPICSAIAQASNELDRQTCYRGTYWLG